MFLITLCLLTFGTICLGTYTSTGVSNSQRGTQTNTIQHDTHQYDENHETFKANQRHEFYLNRLIDRDVNIEQPKQYNSPYSHYSPNENKNTQKKGAANVMTPTNGKFRQTKASSKDKKNEEQNKTLIDIKNNELNEKKNDLSIDFKYVKGFCPEFLDHINVIMSKYIDNILGIYAQSFDKDFSDTVLKDINDMHAKFNNENSKETRDKFIFCREKHDSAAFDTLVEDFRGQVALLIGLLKEILKTTKLIEIDKFISYLENSDFYSQGSWESSKKKSGLKEDEE